MPSLLVTAYPNCGYVSRRALPDLSSLPQNLSVYKRDSWKRKMYDVFDKFGFTLWFILPVCSLFFLCLLHSLAPSLLSEFYPSFPFSLPFFPLSSISKKEFNRGNILFSGAIREHRFFLPSQVSSSILFT